MNQNFFIIISMTSLLLFLFVYLMNKKQSNEQIYQFHLSMKALKSLTESIWNKPHSMLYLPHVSSDNLKIDMSNVFLKTIIMLSSKNKVEITNTHLLTNSLREKILANLTNITILPVQEVINMEIVSIVNAVENNFTVGDRIKVIITSRLLDIDQVIRDNLEFIRYSHSGDLSIDSISATMYRTQFVDLVKIIKNPTSQNSRDEESKYKTYYQYDSLIEEEIK